MVIIDVGQPACFVFGYRLLQFGVAGLEGLGLPSYGDMAACCSIASNKLFNEERPG
jgi:hypothetical protein